MYPIPHRNTSSKSRCNDPPTPGKDNAKKTSRVAFRDGVHNTRTIHTHDGEPTSSLRVMTRSGWHTDVRHLAGEGKVCGKGIRPYGTPSFHPRPRESGSLSSVRRGWVFAPAVSGTGRVGGRVARTESTRAGANGQRDGLSAVGCSHPFSSAVFCLFSPLPNRLHPYLFFSWCGDGKRDGGCRRGERRRFLPDLCRQGWWVPCGVCPPRALARLRVQCQDKWQPTRDPPPKCVETYTQVLTSQVRLTTDPRTRQAGRVDEAFMKSNQSDFFAKVAYFSGEVGQILSFKNVYAVFKYARRRF